MEGYKFLFFFFSFLEVLEVPPKYFYWRYCQVCLGKNSTLISRPFALPAASDILFWQNSNLPQNSAKLSTVIRIYLDLLLFN